MIAEIESDEIVSTVEACVQRHPLVTLEKINALAKKCEGDVEALGRLANAHEIIREANRLQKMAGAEMLYFHLLQIRSRE